MIVELTQEEMQRACLEFISNQLGLHSITGSINDVELVNQKVMNEYGEYTEEREFTARIECEDLS